MSTYITGVTDYIATVQPFRPDFNYYANALQMQQGKYDAAHEQLSSVYGSLLYSPMLRESNIKKRDELFNTINNDLKKISGLDLSKPQNVEKATNLFKPFYEDDNMVKDMTWTKQYQNELQRAENFRGCIDPKKCGGQFWEGGVRALHYKADEFRNATDQDALGFSSPKYTPFVNFTEKAMQAAKDAGFNIKIDQQQGGYIVTTKNGQLLEGPLQSYFTSLFGNDPQMIDMFKTQAYLQRKDFVASNAANFGSPEAAEQQYVSMFMNQATSQFQTQKVNANETFDLLNSRKKSYDEKIEQDGVIIGSDEHNQYIDLLEQLDVAGSVKQSADDADNLVNAAKNSSNINTMRGSIDDIVAMSLFSNEAANAAHTLAYRDYEVSMQADPYALASFNSKLSLQNSLTLKQADYEYWMREKNYEWDHENASLRGSAELNALDPQFGLSGGATSGEKPRDQALQQNQAFRNRLTGERANSKQSFIHQVGTNLADLYAAADSKDQEQIRASLNSVLKGTGINANDFLNGDVAALVSNISRVPKGGNPAGKNTADVNQVYDRLLKILNPADPVGRLNSGWASQIWEGTEDSRVTIKNLDKSLGAFNKHYKAQAQNVISQMQKEIYGGAAAAMTEKEVREQLSNSPFKGTAVEEILVQKHKDSKKTYALDREIIGNMVDAYGKKLDKETFAKTVAKKMQDRFEGTIRSGYADFPANTFDQEMIEKSKKLGSYRTPYQNAYKYALDHYDEYDTGYRETYKAYGVAYNASSPGGQGDGTTSVFHTGVVDPYAYQSDNYMRVKSFMTNFNNARSQEGVGTRFGRADKADEDNILEAAQAASDPSQKVLDQFMLDFNKSYKAADKERPIARIEYGNVADYDSEKTALTIYPDQQWINKYKGTKANPGLTYGMDGSTGITMILPTKYANNQFRQYSDFNQFDFQLEQFGKLTVDEYKNKGGQLDIIKDKTGMRIVGKLIVPDPHTGKFVTTPVNTPIASTFNAEQAYKVVQGMLKQQQETNIQAENYLKQKYGVKNPNQLIGGR